LLLRSSIMDVVATPPLCTGSILWQGTTRVLTVVCKATFTLTPGEATLSTEPEEIHEEDQHLDDDAARSVVSPGDLVPFKARADVILVGNAYAPRGEPTRVLVARMIIGEVDKSIEVQHDRAWAHDGTLHEGARFSRMQLQYERAAGGPDTSNPIGVRPDARPNTFGMVALPNLQPPGLMIGSRADSIAPIGFGPIAPTWPGRRDKLGRHAATWSERGWNQTPLPRDIDPAFFNSAPRDQQVDELRVNERIILENLHPDHPRLVTTLPGVRPRAFLDVAGRAPVELGLRCETLWIDTSRSICTLTWRGHVENPPPAGRVRIALERPGQPLAWAEVEQQTRPAAVAKERKIDESAPPPSTWNRSQTVTFIGADRPTAGSGAVLPFGGSGAGNVRSAAADPLGDRAARSPDPPASTANETLDPRMRSLGQSSPSWLANPPSAATPFAAPSASATPFAAPSPSVAATPFAPPAPVVPPPPSSPAAFIGAPPAAVPAMVAPPRVAADAPAYPPAASPPWSVPESRPGAPAPMTVGQAAAQSATPAPAAPVTPPSIAVTAAPAASDARQIWAGKALVLVWFDADGLPRVHRKEEFKPILRAVEDRAPDSELDDPTMTRDPAGVEDRRDVFEVLSRGAALDEPGLNQALERAIRDDGKFVPPLALVDGEVRFLFDELEALRATLTIATVFAPGDEPLKAAIADAREFLRTPDLRSPPSVTEGYTTRIQDALKRAKRAVAPGYLEEQTERVLVEARHYQRRTVYGAPHLRAQLQIGNSSRPWPLYVPEAAAGKLPMFARFAARVLAEVGFQENQYEAHPTALRALAIGRIASTPGKPDRDG
jgi:hypothetical protein